MKQFSIFPTTLCLLFLLWACEKYDDDPIFPASDFIATGDYQGVYWPTEGWRTCEPDEVGMSPKKMKELNEEIRLLLEMHIEFQSIVVIKDGYIVAEQYYSDDYGPEDIHRIYSCTKSLISSLLGIASGQGLLGSLDQTMVSFFPEYEIQNLDTQKEAISLEHMLTMSAGLDWDEIGFSYEDDRNSYNKWSENGGGIEYVLNLPMLAEPGEEFSYNSGVSQVLSGILQKITGVRADSFALEHLFAPLGIEKYYWPIDNDNVAYGGSGVRLTPREMAKFGYLYLKKGMWDGKQIIPEAWVEASQQKHMMRKYIPDEYYGYQFWVSNDGYYSAVGFAGQWIMIVPEYELVVVFNNRFIEDEYLQWSTPERLLNTYIIPAIK